MAFILVPWVRVAVVISSKPFSPQSATLSSMDPSPSDSMIDSFVTPLTPKAEHIITDVEVKASSLNDRSDGTTVRRKNYTASIP